MRILGINFGHDAAITYIDNGVIKYAIEEEKLSRIKQDFGWPRQAIDRLFLEHGIQAKDIDHVAFGGMIYGTLGEEEIKYRFSKKNLHKNKEIIDRVLAYFKLAPVRISEANKTVIEDCVREEGFVNAKVHFYNHHLCHAASAHYAAPFDSDLIITSDGVGDGESFNFYKFTEGRILPLAINGFESSVGQFYSAITKLLGFRPNRHEGKITGLAAFGKTTRLVEDFSSLFWYDKEILRRYPFGKRKEEITRYQPFDKLNFKDKINKKTSEDALSLEYAENAMLLECKLADGTKGFSKEDIAYACQVVTEEIVLQETRRVIKAKVGNGKNLKVAVAGGVFANVRINQKLLEMPEVDNIFIQPAMGDAGLAMGAAMLADISVRGGTVSPDQYRFTDTYLGPSYSRNEVTDFLQTVKGEAVVTEMKTPAKEIAGMLRDNLVVGFWHGRMEWGPRALGSRSMILNTFDRTVNDSVNKRLNRTEFMPFAPSVIEHSIMKYMPGYEADCPAGDYMTITYDVAKEYHDLLQAVVHVDGTARPQVVRKNITPYYYEIIDEFYKLTDCGAIVNTSFNAHEEPIVSSPAAAYKSLKEDRIDVLVLDNFKIEIARKQ